MPKNQINHLRDHLFETLEALKDPDNPMELERAKAICEISQCIVNSAKVEVDLVRAVRGVAPGTNFFGFLRDTDGDKLRALPAATRIAS